MNLAQASVWLKLIRWYNLAMAFACLLVFRLILVHGARSSDSTLVLKTSGFLFLSFSLLSLMAYGYLRNDMEDEETDRINRRAFRTHPLHPAARELQRTGNILALVGGLSSIGSAWISGLWSWLWLYPVGFLILRGYTRHFKPFGLLANLTVALLIALVPLMLLIPEWSWVIHVTRSGSSPILGVFLMFALFAFFGNLFREMVKDLEDLPGDTAAGIMTLPNRVGLVPGIWVTVLIGLFFALILAWIGLMDPWLLHARPTLVSLATIQVGLSFALLRTREQKGFQRISRVAKWYQALGLILALSLGVAITQANP